MTVFGKSDKLMGKKIIFFRCLLYQMKMLASKFDALSSNKMCFFVSISVLVLMTISKPTSLLVFLANCLPEYGHKQRST